MKTIVCHGDSLTEGADLNPNKKGHLLMAAQAAQLLKSTFYLA